MVYLIHHPLAGPQIRQMGGRGGYLMLAPSRHWWLLWLINRPRVSRGATLDPHLDGSSRLASLFATMRAIQITPVAFPALSFSTPSWGSTCPLSLPFTLCMCWEFLCLYLTLPAPACACAPACDYACACACTWPCQLLPLTPQWKPCYTSSQLARSMSVNAMLVELKSTKKAGTVNVAPDLNAPPNQGQSTNNQELASSLAVSWSWKSYHIIPTLIKDLVDSTVHRFWFRWASQLLLVRHIFLALANISNAI